MRPRMRIRYAIVLLAALAGALLVGCGGGGSSSGSDPASIVPPGVPVFVEATLKPEGDAGANVEALAEKIAGIENLGETATKAIEESAASSGEAIDFSKDIEPWLGNRSGVYLESYEGSEFNAGGVMVETTDTGEAQEFIDSHVESSGESKKATYEGVEYVLDPGDGQSIGIIGNFIAFGESEQSFKAMVDASKGESLADQDSYSESISNLPDESVANVFADIGTIVSESGGKIDPETQAFLETVGITPKEATAEISLIPGANQIEVDLSTNAVSGGSSGNGSELLASLPGGAFAAFVSADFGSRFEEAINRLDERGIPGQVEPGELKSGLEASGINLDQIGASLGDLGVFLQGNTQKNPTGAVVLSTEGEDEATNTVSNIGLLLRSAGTPGVTAISGNLTGFSVRSDSFGGKPLVVAAEGERIAISLGVAAATQALKAGQGATLGANPEYKEAITALGSTPITGFIAGPAALQFATDFAASTEENEGFEKAKPYLEEIAYVAIGTDSSNDRTTARLIVGLSK
jgi:Protein of unknown function (DUF3352)